MKKWFLKFLKLFKKMEFKKEKINDLGIIYSPLALVNNISSYFDQDLWSKEDLLLLELDSEGFKLELKKPEGLVINTCAKITKSESLVVDQIGYLEEGAFKPIDESFNREELESMYLDLVSKNEYLGVLAQDSFTVLCGVDESRIYITLLQ